MASKNDNARSLKLLIRSMHNTHIPLAKVKMDGNVIYIYELLMRSIKESQPSARTSRKKKPRGKKASSTYTSSTLLC